MYIQIVKSISGLGFCTVILMSGCSDSSSNSQDAPIPAKMEAPDPVPKKHLSLEERGQKVYARCKTCHTLEKGGRQLIGPNLWGVFGNTAGSVEGFKYSRQMMESGIVWDETRIDAYIENPGKYMPGNKMAFVGLRKTEDREAVIAYMKQKTGVRE